MSVRFAAGLRKLMLDHAFACHPEEACGLLAGGGDDQISGVYPTTNILHSSTNYTIDPSEHMRAIRAADDKEIEISGVFHSHPHTEGFPSPTDVALAPDPGWLYVLIGFDTPDEPTVRGFRITDGQITEETLQFEEQTP